jgi:class 3 adenylate cyclase
VTTRPVERRIVSVLFADLVGFTSLSERLDPEDVALVQDAYFDAVRQTVDRHGGLLEKLVGDAAMAVFGAPRTKSERDGDSHSAYWNAVLTGGSGGAYVRGPVTRRSWMPEAPAAPAAEAEDTPVRVDARMPVEPRVGGGT